MANVYNKHHSSFLYIGNRIFRFNLTEIKSPFLFSSDFQKPDEWTEPMKSKQVKEAKDKKAVFNARFSRENMKAKWYFKRDVSNTNIFDLI